MKRADILYLRFLARQHLELERLCAATINRSKALQRDGLDPLGEAVLSLQADVTSYAQQLQALTTAKTQAARAIERWVANSPYADWLAPHKGLGSLWLGRSLAMMGDPYMRLLIDPQTKQITGEVPRTRGQLRAYLGLDARDGCHPRYGKGEKQRKYNAEAKKALYLCALNCIRRKADRPPWRRAYEANYAGAQGKVHTVRCQNSVRPHSGASPQTFNGCGTSAHPEYGEPGSPWRAGHINMHATMLTAWQIAADLYDFSKSLHGAGRYEPTFA